MVKNWKELSFINNFENINEHTLVAQKENNLVAHRHDQSLLSITIKNSMPTLNVESQLLKESEKFLNDNIKIERRRAPFEFEFLGPINLKIKKVFYYLYVLENKIKKNKRVRKFIIFFYSLRKNS